MKEDMLEVLVYLFEYYIADGLGWDTDHKEIEQELLGAGFDGTEIDKAFLWLEELLIVCEQESIKSFDDGKTNLVRHFLPEERARFGSDGEALLIRLINTGVLDLNSREMVIDRVMALDSSDVNVDHIKWVVLMVLSNQPGFEEVAEWAETIVTNGVVPLIH